MIHIKDQYYLDADANQFKLLTKTKSEKGKISYPIAGYYPSIALLLIDLVKIEAFKAVTALQDLSEVLEHVRQFGDSLRTPLVGNIKQAIKCHELASPNEGD